jgi:UDP-N-acetylglucosamine--N-acetylmuramyl-(pentapeptide) pyrophosphoryl-undecaprenol N-acetylglucosamine transferase
MKFLLVGGGTLGSVNPLLAIAKAIQTQKPDSKFIFWGSRNPLDREVVEAAGIKFKTIAAGKLRRYFSIVNFFDFFIIVFAFFISFFRLLFLRPQMILTAGSYVAVPVVWAAACLRIRILVYQQDIELGLANKLMQKLAGLRTATTSETAKLLKPPAHVVGYAIRPDLRNGNPKQVYKIYNLDPKHPIVLVIGGSSGAKDINELVIKSLPYVSPEIQFLHITGRGKEIKIQRDGYHPIPFVNRELPDLYAAANFVICRAGSNVLSEIIFLKKNALIIPLPDTHQEQNSREYSKLGGLVKNQAEISAIELANIIMENLRGNNETDVLQISWNTEGANNIAKLVLKDV